MDTTVRERLEADLKTAMRSGDRDTRDAIRFILSAIKNAEIEARVGAPLDEAATLRKMGKQLTDAATQYREAGRPELAEAEAYEAGIIEAYLPAELGDAELDALVARAIEATGAEGPRDMGKAIKHVMDAAGGRADGKRVSTKVKEALS